MRTSLRKLKLSFLSMVCGWVACNIAWWVGAVFSIDAITDERLSIPSAIALATTVGIFTAIVVTVAWLVIFLPVDLLVPDDTKLRSPKIAAICGFLAAFAIVSSAFVAAAWYPMQRSGFWLGTQETADIKMLPYALATCVTGTVAAFSRSRMGKSTSKTA